jgi:hypothetical protein
MRKGTAEAKFGTVVFNLKTWDTLKQMGYKYVQIKGLTVDRHYDYLEQWATEVNDFTEILIANRLKNNQA